MASLRCRWVVWSFLALGCGGDDSSDKSSGTPTTAGATEEGSATGSNTEGTTEGTGGTTVSSATGGGSSGGTATGGGTSGDGGLACGRDLACDPSSQYCELIASNTGGRDAYFCRDLPQACLEDLDCECLIEAECGAGGGVCNDDNGGFEVGCDHG